MRKIILFSTLVTFLLILPIKSFAFYKTLSDSLIKDAISYGQINSKMDAVKFSELWVFDKKRGYIPEDWEYCVVETKYFLLAHSSREATQKYQTLNSITINSINESKYLVFRFRVFGNDLGFASDLHSVIKIDTLIIQPAEKINEDFASPSPFWPDSPAYSAYCSHRYLLKKIPNNAQIQLVIIRYGGEETIYDIDLSKIKWD